MQFFAFPFHGFCVFVVKFDIVEDFCFQFIDGVKITSRQDSPGQAAEPDFDLVQPRTMFRCVNKPYPMRRILQKCPTGFLRFQDATLVLLAQVVRRQTAQRHNQHHQRHGLVRI